MIGGSLQGERYRLLGEIAAVLYGHGAQHVWVFGSLGQNRRQDRRSDIDIAVGGLSARALNAARLEVFAIARCRVDILTIEGAPPMLRWALRRDGRILPRPDAAQPASLSLTAPEPAGDLPTLHRRRIDAVAEMVLARAARSVIDFGCGHGWLLDRLWRSGEVDRLTGVDFEPRVLVATRRRLDRLERAHPGPRAALVHGLFTYADPRYAGHEAATATEVIEHLEPAPLAAFSGVLFQRLRIPLVVLTTPNAEFNAVFGGDSAGRYRHSDHRFEWTRGEFAAWAGRQAAAFGYRCDIHSIGPEHPAFGPPSQMAVFIAAPG